MIWQDIVLMIGGFVFAVALLPSVLGKHKPAASSSIATMIVLHIFCAVYVTLDLWLTFGATLITSTLWLVLAVQKLKNK